MSEESLHDYLEEHGLGVNEISDSTTAFPDKRTTEKAKTKTTMTSSDLSLLRLNPSFLDALPSILPLGMAAPTFKAAPTFDSTEHAAIPASITITFTNLVQPVDDNPLVEVFIESVKASDESLGIASIRDGIKAAVEKDTGASPKLEEKVLSGSIIMRPAAQRWVRKILDKTNAVFWRGASCLHYSTVAC
ncbi:hypothetical protein BT69DRAFT_1285681 [Atractiella rhizophila]|nr:hypothetical protein BT69DRAFT_1285681 [Atractiella rhizophila]